MTNRARPNTARRNSAFAAVTGVVAGLLFLYPTSFDHSVGSTSTVQASTAPTASASTGTGSTRAQPIGYSKSTSSATGSSTAGSATAGSTSTTSGTRTVTGSAVETRYGPVQVQLTINGGKIVSAAAIEYPDSNGRDGEINSYAIPQLNSEVVAAQSASIDTVSGATYTSGGYLKSLQAALDSAHLA